MAVGGKSRITEIDEIEQYVGLLLESLGHIADDFASGRHRVGRRRAQVTPDILDPGDRLGVTLGRLLALLAETGSALHELLLLLLELFQRRFRLGDRRSSGGRGRRV